jgi:hypothetical protein
VTVGCKSGDILNPFFECAPPGNKNFWRINGEYLEVVKEGAIAPALLRLFKQKDPKKNQTILVIQWNTGSSDYRTYYPVIKQ